MEIIYFVEINNNQITCKGQGFDKTEEQIEVSEEIFNALTRLPATFTQDTEGNIVSVTLASEPEPITSDPTIQEMLLTAYQEIADLKSRIEVLEGV